MEKEIKNLEQEASEVEMTDEEIAFIAGYRKLNKDGKDFMKSVIDTACSSTLFTDNHSK